MMVGVVECLRPPRTGATLGSYPNLGPVLPLTTRSATYTWDDHLHEEHHASVPGLRVQSRSVMHERNATMSLVLPLFPRAKVS